MDYSNHFHISDNDHDNHIHNQKGTGKITTIAKQHQN